ncbi:hypothetical protein [Terrisporobacter petrolearius]|uniref:hypothetical protein n=1 Tax=Terrisporobacter petrolearius TaxID=1460447 RepID=UPI0031CC52A3
MIKLKVDENKMKEIEEKHWEWFKDSMLKNWIVKMNKETDDKFLQIFFDNRNAFEKWFDKASKDTVKKWFQKQEDEKFNVFKEFIVGNIDELNRKKVKLESSCGTKNEIGTYLKSQYQTFRTSKNQWGGAHLINELNINVCPYCNRSFVDTYICDKNGKLISNAQLDHFYAKDKYPFLAVSLYNLIPSCGVCNHGKLNDNNKVIYPYEEEFGEDAKFETKFYTDEDVKDDDKIYDIKYLLGNSDNFKIGIEPKEPKSEIGEKIQNSIKTFHLKELYNFHKDYVRELIKKAIVYNESRIDELYTEFPELFSSKEEVLQMVISNYICDEDLGKRPLSKLTKDICDELGLKLSTY